MDHKIKARQHTDQKARKGGLQNSKGKESKKGLNKEGSGSGYRFTGPYWKTQNPCLP
eukprot:c16578_g1_i1 orf=28-198(+)